ncbi:MULTISPECIES: GNAT family N-acetyltransferase [unclassified Kitasatospora]|uniref:GNAT family N-acetyltransferase n=1 Tax=unclassified Kitasatospora TaxID=2633591 RepID=UPI000708E404|nr:MULTISPECIES: GNAT family N-acetyltransferase [unclassified Kitasatospora]KQV23794.1 acetyltransferase [Kitasatospora sp. Root107]KRB67493.1 acetyltransferase [Kitasatospora sp. Root187]
MDLVIRRAVEADLEAVGAVTHEAFVGDGHSPADGPYAAQLLDARPRFEQAELLVAVDPADGRVLGCVTFAVGGTGFADIAEPSEGEIRMLAVGGAARGRGAGEALVRASIARSRELGLTGMAFSTRPSMTSAHRLYERLGFRRAPERDWDVRPGVRLLVYTMVF